MRPTAEHLDAIRNPWAGLIALLALMFAAATVVDLQACVVQYRATTAALESRRTNDALSDAVLSLRAAQANQHIYYLTGNSDHAIAADAAFLGVIQSISEARSLIRESRPHSASAKAVEEEAKALHELWSKRAAIFRPRLQASDTATTHTASFASLIESAERLELTLRHMIGAERERLDAHAGMTEASYMKSISTRTVMGVFGLFASSGSLVALMLYRRRADQTMRTLREVNKKMVDAHRRKDNFLATLAHELRNPLAPIRNAAAIISRFENVDEKMNWAVTMIQRQVSQTSAILDDLSDVARISQGKFQLSKQDTGLDRIVNDAIETVTPLIERKGHTLETHLPTSPVIVAVDPVRLGQAVANLLMNAAKYTNPGGKILFSAEARDHELLLRVADNGIGIAPEAVAGLFDMFTQVEAGAERAEGGLGIGLALTRGFVELHGGRVKVESKGLGHGSEFVIEIPNAVVGSAERIPDVPPLARQRTTSSRKKVLVADDNRDSADSTAFLVEMAGHDVKVAYCGREAIALTDEFWPDVALLDIGLPDIDGYEVARVLRGRFPGHTMKIIALTGWGRADDRVRSGAAGFDAHLTKPIDPAHINTLIALADSLTLKAGPPLSGAP